MTKTILLGAAMLLAVSGAVSAAERQHATGFIAVTKYEPVPYDEGSAVKLAEINVEEVFSGGIEGTGKVRFLQAARADGSASFCGLERFVGTLGGRKGSFVLQDVGTLVGNQVEGTWSIVAGSGTEELAGITGDGGFSAKLGEHAAITLDYSFDK